MVMGAVIAIVLGWLGVPWVLAIVIGIGYFLIAVRMTPRSAYVGGVFGPRPRPGEIPGPGSLREMDLSPEDLAEMSTHNKQVLAEIGSEFRVDVTDFRYGNIGHRQGQYAELTVRLPPDSHEAALARGRAIQLVVTAVAPQSDDVREARVRFVGVDGKRVAESVVDMSAAGGLTDRDDEEAMATYAAGHSRTREFD